MMLIMFRLHTHVHMQSCSRHPTLIHSFIHSLIHSFTHSLIHSFTHSLTHSLIHSLTHSLIHSLTHSFTHSLAHSLTRSFIHSFVHSFIHSTCASSVASPVCLCVCVCNKEVLVCPRFHSFSTFSRTKTSHFGTHLYIGSFLIFGFFWALWRAPRGSHNHFAPIFS